MQYIKYRGKNLSLKGAKLEHSLVKTVEEDAGELEPNYEWRWASEETHSHDLLPYSICQQLKCMQKGHLRTEVQQWYIHALLKKMGIAFLMRETAQETDPEE